MYFHSLKTCHTRFSLSKFGFQEKQGLKVSTSKYFPNFNVTRNLCISEKNTYKISDKIHCVPLTVSTVRKNSFLCIPLLVVTVTQCNYLFPVLKNDNTDPE